MTLGLFSGLLPLQALAAEGPLQVIVPWPAGGVVDVVARAIAPKLGEDLGRGVVIANRAGAGGNIGSTAVVRASAVNDTVLITSSALAMNQALLGDRMPFDLARDLVPVTGIAVAHQVVVVRSDGKYGSIGALIDAAKQRPKALNFASAGAGSPAHLAAELLKTTAGLDVTHIPYQGAPAALTAVAAGDVDFFMSPIPPALALIKGGKLRALAVSGTRRSDNLPGIPTVAESGYPGYEASQWIGIFTARGFSTEAQQRIVASVRKALEDPQFMNALRATGVEPMAVGQSEFRSVIDADLKRWRDLVRQARITAE